MPALFDFEPIPRAGLTWHVMTAADADVPGPCWPGLWELEYEDDAELNPFWRFSVNNQDGEALAVWRAVAWAITDAPVRAAIPRYDRDQVAAYLGIPREQTAFIRWEYELDYESAPFDVADHGFVPARSAIPICPAPSDWERRHRDLAGLFPVQTLNTLHRIDAAISFDVASEMSLIGLTDRGFADLQDCLSGQEAPLLADLLGNVGVFAHLTVVRDRFLGHHTYFAVASKRDLSESLDVLAQHYGDQWARYRAEMPAQSSFQDFVAAMERLLAPAASPSDPPLPRP